MKVIEALRSGEYTLDTLNSKLGINVVLHPEDGRVILNYDMIDSPRTHPIVCECRALVLDRFNDYNLVARSFNRFFNLGEQIEHHQNFRWNDELTITDKVDGSLILLYWYNNQWNWNTRGSFANGFVNGLDITWKDICEVASKDIDFSRLGKHITYVFELCSPYNKVVKYHPEPKLYILSMFLTSGGWYGEEFDYEDMEDIAIDTNMLLPEIYRFNSVDDIKSHIQTVSQTDAAYEGVVVRDVNNNRIKIKSEKYVSLHALRGDGDNLFHPKYLLPFIVSGDTDEICAYFPEVKSTLFTLKAKYDALVESMCELYIKNKDEQYQKNFALAIKDHPLSSVMFAARKTDSDPRKLVTEEQFNKVLLYNLYQKDK